MSNKVYDKLKWVAQILLPLVSTLYYGLGQIWGFPKITEVIGSIAVLDTALGLFLTASNRQYMNSEERFDGQIIVSDNKASINVEGDPHEVLETKPELLLKVENEDVANRNDLAT